MKTLFSPIVITLPEIYANEAQALEALVEAGAEIIHLRKPDSSEPAIEELLDPISPQVRQALTLHYNPALAVKFGLGGIHCRAEQLPLSGYVQANLPESGQEPVKAFRTSISCHTWEEAKALAGKVDYVFLSPLFDSVSKQGYKAAFDYEELRIRLTENNRPEIVALGGITTENIARVEQLGFEGAALIGSIWTTRGDQIDIQQSVENYKRIKEAWIKSI